MNYPWHYKNSVAAITGAASGIGRALAVDLAQRGAHLALSDVDEDGLRETVAQCEGRSVKVTSQLVDVADRDAVFRWAADVVEAHGAVHMIVNNAGVALSATAEASSPEDFEWLMGINFWGVVHGTQAFLPHLKAAGRGHVVNISSVFGLVSIPTQAAYNAAKFGVRGYTDALRIELDLQDCGVSSTTIHPGGIKTNIARSARSDMSVATIGADAEGDADEFDKLARTTPEKAAAKILKSVEKNRRRALIGPDAVVFDIVSRLPLVVSQRILAARVRRG